MSEWKKVKIGAFLKQYRNTIYVDDAQQYRQVTISSKDGVKYRCTKIGKEIGRKRQFLIDLKKYPNTVIFTRQGLHEGSIGLAPEEVDGCIATENMPMFSVDDTVIDTQYLKNLLRSPIFANLVSTLTPTGSAQKSIHERDLLPLEISIPDLETQKKIVKEISSQLEKTEQLSSEIEKQKSYAKQLRQNILQEAIEGKLTADWRKQHPIQKGNPDYDAEALFDKIQAEKSRTKNSPKTVAPITEDDIPFEIPTNWKWVRLGEIINLLSGRDFEPTEYNDKQEGIPYITGASNIGENGIIINRWTKTPKCIAKYGDLLLVCKGSGYGTLAYADFEQAHIARQIMSITSFSKYISLKYIEFILRANFLYLKTQGKGLIPGIDRDTVLNIFVGLPPLAEQKEIVARVEQHLQTVTQLETQIATRETTTKQLMQSILKNAFEEK
ncbi:restriction endonuclease subunit S [Fibrobacter sp.]|uniref:restriction endonuclease subunit S n=1 Tax=Fibrobacter sp. TaxID=35828 RepID=UPI0025BF9729|nr:restriction endonuclease subunit S [Fibrobacter sp.]MBR4007304.1 restriction endonuclease subunit S [Fibrobacter sp.]